MQKGIQNRARAFHAFQQWKSVAARKRSIKVMDAGREGMYSQR
jgi:hypothetical protein